VFAVSVPVDSVPEAALAPDQPPEAVHEVAFVDDQARAEAVPLGTNAGVAVNDTVGAGRMVTVTEALALPPAPVQVRV